VDLLHTRGGGVLTDAVRSESPLKGFPKNYDNDLEGNSFQKT